MAYSFNHPMGMCPDCSGLGERWRLVEDRLFDLGKTLREGAIRFSQFSAGLHPADAEKIGRLLTGLRDRHNSVFVVEHNRQMIELADHIVEMGPNAGTAGGAIVFQGSLAELKAAGTATGFSVRLRVSPTWGSDTFRSASPPARCRAAKSSG